MAGSFDGAFTAWRSRLHPSGLRARELNEALLARVGIGALGLLPIEDEDIAERGSRGRGEEQEAQQDRDQAAHRASALGLAGRARPGNGTVVGRGKLIGRKTPRKSARAVPSGFRRGRVGRFAKRDGVGAASRILTRPGGPERDRSIALRPRAGGRRGARDGDRCNSGATNRCSAGGTQSAFLPSVRVSNTTRTEGDMLWTIFVILLVLWLLGMVSSYTLGGFIHVLLIIAIAVVLIQLISGRRAV
jgi:hypothetical protein